MTPRLMATTYADRFTGGGFRRPRTLSSARGGAQRRECRRGGQLVLLAPRRSRVSAHPDGVFDVHRGVRTPRRTVVHGAAGTHIVVDVDVVVQMGSPIPQVSRKVHQRIVQHIAALTGLTTHEVNVTVVDVVPSTRTRTRPAP